MRRDSAVVPLVVALVALSGACVANFEAGAPAPSPSVPVRDAAPPDAAGSDAIADGPDDASHEAAPDA